MHSCCHASFFCLGCFLQFKYTRTNRLNSMGLWNSPCPLTSRLVLLICFQVVVIGKKIISFFWKFYSGFGTSDVGVDLNGGQGAKGGRMEWEAAITGLFQGQDLDLFHLPWLLPSSFCCQGQDLLLLGQSSCVWYTGYFLLDQGGQPVVLNQHAVLFL